MKKLFCDAELEGLEDLHRRLKTSQAFIDRPILGSRNT
jgi:hypothetical protein